MRLEIYSASARRNFMLTRPASSPTAQDTGPGSDLVPAWWPLALTGITVRTLSREHCLRLLATEITGRLFVLQRPTYPLPIRFRVSHNGLVIDPPPEIGGSLADRHQLVMVCVDRLEPDELYGWSLVVVGPLLPHTDEVDERTGTDRAPALLDLSSLTGRSFATTFSAPHLELPSDVEARVGFADDWPGPTR